MQQEDGGNHLPALRNKNQIATGRIAMTKPADSGQIAKARRKSEIAEREKKATKGPWARTGLCMVDHSYHVGTPGGNGGMKISEDDAIDILVADAGGDMDTSEANAEFIAHARADIPFLLSALASERQAVIEECCRAVCNRCARPDKYEFFNCETRKHRLFDSGELYECRAAAIRSME